MYYFSDGDIIPGVGIGQFKLGMNFDDVKKIMPDFEIEERAGSFQMMCKNIEITIENDSGNVKQVLVKDDFKGKYAGKIGLGNTLTDVKNLLGVGWYEHLDVFILNDAPGMGFELGDTDDPVEWDELTPPIEYICVFPPELYTEPLEC